MKTIIIQKFQCELCGTLYDDREIALKCESRPVTHDECGIGDVVMITQGDGKGLTLRVEEKTVASMEYGHYAWDRYWHTELVSGKIELPDRRIIGERVLNFDSRQRL